MSRFFRALEQAEHDRALRDQERRDGPPREPKAPDTGTVELVATPPSTAPPADHTDGSVDAHRVRGATASDCADGSVDAHLVSLLAPASLAAEHYRVLAHTIEQRRRDSVVVVAVTSAAAGDGKSITAVNLAGALAHFPGARVLLLELDLREPSLALRLGLGGSRRTLGRALVDAAVPLHDVVTRLAPFNLDVVVAGEAVPTPYELLKSRRLGDLLAVARAGYDHVIVDTPPAIPYPDSRAIARLADGFLVVVGAHHTPRKLLEDTLGVLEPATVIGLVFNGDDEPASAYYAPPNGATVASPRSRRRRYARLGTLGAWSSRVERH